MLVFGVLIASTMYVVKAKDGGFKSIPININWTIITLTTVGYSDISSIRPPC